MAQPITLHFFLVLAILVVTGSSSSSSSSSPVTGKMTMTLINFTQQLDHFSVPDDSITFQQRLYVNDRHWTGAKSKGPIFVFLEEEESKGFQGEIGLLSDCAEKFGAMVIYIEHRFYGHSIPLGSIELAMADHYIRGCLTIQQALEDYRVIIQSLKANLTTQDSPVVVVGGGYSGVLAAYFRLKYPDVVVGALASSAPMLLYGTGTTIDGYCSIVSKDFEDYNPLCHQRIIQSWTKIDKVPSQPGELKRLRLLFRKCSPFESIDELKQRIAGLYSFAAQYDSLNNDWIRSICVFVNFDYKDELEGIATAFTETLGYGTCSERYGFGVQSPFEPSSSRTIAWDWQRCNELIVPASCEQGSMLPSRPFNFTEFIKSCQLKFDVTPNAQNSMVASYFGCKDIKEALRRFGSNVIFSNGLRDPVSIGGILEDISETITTITTTKGTHQQDLYTKEDDPAWLVKQRHEELKIFERWIGASIAKSLAMSRSTFIKICLSLILLSFI